MTNSSSSGGMHCLEVAAISHTGLSVTLSSPSSRGDQCHCGSRISQYQGPAVKVMSLLQLETPSECCLFAFQLGPLDGHPVPWTLQTSAH